MSNDFKWYDGDIVSIKLDLKAKAIEYFVNNKSVGITFENIPYGDDIKYRLAINPVMTGVMFKLMNFEYL